MVFQQVHPELVQHVSCGGTDALIQHHLRLAAKAVSEWKETQNKTSLLVFISLHDSKQQTQYSMVLSQ
jgi:hypothetical protein